MTVVDINLPSSFLCIPPRGSHQGHTRSTGKCILRPHEHGDGKSVEPRQFLMGTEEAEERQILGQAPWLQYLISCPGESGGCSVDDQQ